MEIRILFLTVPSALVLALLVAHSLRTLPRRRALGFWGAVVAFGFLRGWAVAWITEGVLGASFPATPWRRWRGCRSRRWRAGP